ncbi:hypothetical protein M9Y10_014048 [Tritrichomonas musculus]|uniref:Uncharacterized protein n=1 Tax=Tritrichomonas musculus TaxID=1915356 RepID=A0ABR2KYH7_9EUKA
MSCTNCNFSNNRNNFHSDPADARQQSFGFTFLTTSNNQKFKYVNYIGNDGDCVMEIPFKAYLDISSVNVINNVNLNFFFYNDPDGPQSSESGVDHKIVCQNFAFFGNQKSSLTDRIKVANALVSYQFSLVNCFFDYSSSELNLMLNGHVESNSQCSMPTTMVVHSDVLARWYYCTIPSSIFTLSSVFTETSIFSETSQFSKSITFSESSHFTGSSTFSESLTFSESSHFSISLTFSDSEIFLELPSFVQSLLFTDKFLTQSMTFTPSKLFSI